MGDDIHLAVVPYHVAPQGASLRCCWCRACIATGHELGGYAPANGVSSPRGLYFHSACYAGAIIACDERALECDDFR